MPVTRVVVLWHQHQPFYKDLVSGEYCLPWVRLHGLKDYYGMVKLLDEFPGVHQIFNLVPSLITQIQEYVAGTAQDPFLRVASKPATELTSAERRFALQYLFQANPENLIGRYPRYRELQGKLQAAGGAPEKAERYFQAQDFTDLQVLSQVAWFDEFFLAEPEVAKIIQKGRGFSREEQNFVIGHQRELLAQVLPAHAAAAQRGGIEISTSPFYHPILPLVCDTNAGGISSPGLPLPHNRFCRPEDAREQLQRGLDLHQKVFGVRPVGVWPSEGSVSEEALAIAQSLGVKWMATDEGVLGRSLGMHFSRDGEGRLPGHLAEKLYTIQRFHSERAEMNMIFRDHTISDLVGFVYSGMPAQDAANHLMHNIRQAAQPLLNSGRDAMIPIILDGENAWEYYPQSGREFLRRFYDALQKEPGMEAVTVSEAIARHKNTASFSSLVPGSWINANFNVWIGAPEDNRSWDFLYHAREFYEQKKSSVGEAQRQLAFEELLIAEGSDWNWWYGPEHHTVNDREFDELYRKHLSNVYQALGATPPDYLAQPIIGSASQPELIPQTAYIHPHITGERVRYFEWMGAALYHADHRAGAMHGKQFLLDCSHVGIDEVNLYGRLDFIGKIPEGEFKLIVNIESWADNAQRPRRAVRIDASIGAQTIQSWEITSSDEQRPLSSAANPNPEALLALVRSFEFGLPLSWLLASPVALSSLQGGDSSVATRLRIRFSLWQNGLPVDALPAEGWIQLPLLEEKDLESLASNH
jgi:alpha-amylase/alpha-mannosidase (GH57 family)